MQPAAKRRLGDIFVERRLITDHQLERALEAQRTSGGKLGETLVELGFVSRVDLAGVISEQWDEVRQMASGRKQAEAETQAEAQAQAEAQRTVVAAESVVETAVRERLEAVTAELVLRDQRIAEQDATIAALLTQLGSSAVL